MALFDNINFNKLKSGLSKTRDKIVNSINEKITGKAVIDENIIDEIEQILITSDIGYDTAEKIIELYNKRDEISGLKMVYEPPYLRFFQSRFEKLPL